MRNNWDIIAKISIIIGFVISLFPYFLIIGGPFYIIGLLILWFTLKSIKTLVYWTFIPLIIWYPLMLLFTYCITNHTTPSTILIPQNFRGKIHIIYDEPCGIKLPVIENKKIFRIPNNGILIVSDKSETGFTDNEFYFTDNKGNKIDKIEEFYSQDFNEEYSTNKNKKEPPRNKIAIFSGGIGCAKYLDEREITFEEIYVLTYENYRKFNDSKSNNLTTEIVNSCRNGQKLKPSR